MRAPDLDEGHQGHQRQHVSRRRTRSSKRVRRGRGLQEPDCPAHVVEASMIVVGKAGAPPRPRTLSARLTRQQPRRAVNVGLAGPPHRAARLGKAARANQSVDEAASAAPHRAWPWPLMPARPHPVRPLPSRPEATVNAPQKKEAKIEGCYRKTACCSFDEQVKNKTTKRPTPRFCRTSR